MLLPSNESFLLGPHINLVPGNRVEVADQRHSGSDASKDGSSSNEGEEEVLERRGNLGGLGSERMGESSASRDDNGSLESSSLVLLGLGAAMESEGG